MWTIPEYRDVRRHYEGYRALGMFGRWQQDYTSDVLTLIDMNIFRLEAALRDNFDVPPYWIDVKVECQRGLVNLGEIRNLCLQK